MSMRKYKNVWYKIGRIQRNRKIEINVSDVLTYIRIRCTMYLEVKETGSQAKQPTGSAEGGKYENIINRKHRRNTDGSNQKHDGR